MYFTDPYCAWQMGTNENSNGLLREFYPKGRNLSRVAPATLKRNLALINARPRKVLNSVLLRICGSLNSLSVALSLTIRYVYLLLLVLHVYGAGEVNGGGTFVFLLEDVVFAGEDRVEADADD